MTNVLNKLGIFQSTPTPPRLGFVSFLRVCVYLLKYPNLLLCYPRKPIDSFTTFTSPSIPTHYITVPHSLCGFSDNASNSASKLHQIDWCSELIGTVVAYGKTIKNVSCSILVIGNKIQALFREAKQCRKLWIFLQQIGTMSHILTHVYNSIKILLSQPTTIFGNNKGEIDCVNAYK